MSPFPSSSKARPALRTKRRLAAQVEEDLKIKNEGYTKQSWAHFQEALAHAQSILNDDSATQQEIEAALLRLNEARAALQKIEGTMTEKEQLEQAFSHAQSIRTNTIPTTAGTHSSRRCAMRRPCWPIQTAMRRITKARCARCKTPSRHCVSSSRMTPKIRIRQRGRTHGSGSASWARPVRYP